MKVILALSTCCLLLSSCSSDNSSRPSDRRSVADTRVSESRGGDSRFDDSRVGESRSDELLTPQNQSESSEDRRITQLARQAVINRGNLSTNAKNVKIITVDRVVQLRGNVDSEAERREIVQVVRSVPGIQRVDEKLVISNK